MPYKGPQGQSLDIYETFERPNPLDDYAAVKGGTNTVAVTTDAAFPERGDKGLETTATDSTSAYISWNPSLTIEPGESRYIGFWFNPEEWTPGNNTTMFNALTAAGLAFRVKLYPTRRAYAYAHNDVGGSSSNGSVGDIFTVDRMHYLVIRLKRAATDVSADGGIELYVDGQRVAGRLDVDNYDLLNDPISEIRLGAAAGSASGFRLYFDEITIPTAADEYPQPYVPAATTDYPDDVNRMAVLYKSNEEDSITVADHLASELGIPRSNLIPLTNATTAETAANFATFETEVEDDLNAWLALNTDAAAQITTLITSYLVPNFFIDSGAVSAVSRLMDLGNAYSKNKANPFYQQSGRVTATELLAAGMYCVTAVDMPTVANSLDLIDNGLFVNTSGRIDAGSNLIVHDAMDLASLSAQKTRMDRLAIGTGNEVSILIGDLSTETIPPDDEPGGDPRLVVDFNAVTTLRTTTPDIIDTLVNSSYPCGAAWEAPADFDTEAFLDCFHAGGSYAEACLVASKYVNSSQVAVGIPNLQIYFSLGGYDICLGEGGPEAIDWSSPIAYLSPTEVQVQLNLPLAANVKYVAGVKPISSAGIAACSGTAFTYLEVDDNGLLQPAPLGQPTDVTAHLLGDGEVLVAFSSHAPSGMIEPASYEIVTDGGTGTIDLDAPVATVEPTYSGQREFDVTFNHGSLPAQYAVRGRNDAQLGPLSKIVTVIPAATPSLPPVL